MYNDSRKFDTILIASFVEMCCLTNIDFSEVLDLCSYITGEKISEYNIREKRDKIIELLQEQYPGIERHYYACNGSIATKEIIDYYKKMYLHRYGEHMKIRRPEKRKILSLKNTLKQ